MDGQICFTLRREAPKGRKEKKGFASAPLCGFVRERGYNLTACPYRVRVFCGVFKTSDRV